jgi:hypothetical protein
MAREQGAQHSAARIVVDSVAMFDELIVHGEVMCLILTPDEGISGELISFLCFFFGHMQADLHLMRSCGQNFFGFFGCFVCRLSEFVAGISQKFLSVQGFCFHRGSSFIEKGFGGLGSGLSVLTYISFCLL